MGDSYDNSLQHDYVVGKGGRIKGWEKPVPVPALPFTHSLALRTTCLLSGALVFPICNMGVSKLGLQETFYPLSQFLLLAENGHNAVMGKI